MIYDLHAQVCSVASLIVCVDSRFRHLIRHNVKSIASLDGEVLILGRVVDAVLSNELEGSIGTILLKNADCAFGEGNAKPIFIGVQKFHEIYRIDFLLIESSGTNSDFMVFIDGNVEHLRNELDLLLRALIESD